MDDELRRIRNKLLIGILVVIIFCLPIGFLINNKFGNKKSLIIEKINNKEDFLILVTESENVKCHDIINLLESYNLEFNILNRTEDANYYKTIDKINIEESDITPPTLIYMKEGEFYSFLVSERENDIKSYLEANNIIEND